MGEMVTLITNVGFPIAVATYLLIRFESKIDGLSQSIDKLTSVVGTQLSLKDDKVA
nr:YvrJ family protein [Clostridium chromiireducens]